MPARKKISSSECGHFKEHFQNENNAKSEVNVAQHLCFTSALVIFTHHHNHNVGKNTKHNAELKYFIGHYLVKKLLYYVIWLEEKLKAGVLFYDNFLQVFPVYLFVSQLFGLFLCFCFVEIHEEHSHQQVHEKVGAYKYENHCEYEI
jgi:hypothetical protein